MSRVLVTGAAGMLGSVLVPTLLDAGHDVCASDITGRRGVVNRLTYAHIDVRDPSTFDWFEFTEPEVVIHLAALTSLEECEADPDNAWHTNALGTKYVAQACQRAGIPMLYVSTAGVFDGSSTRPYTEFDTPAPVNTYGSSKLAGERFVAASQTPWWIVRAGWMESGGPGVDKKFVALVMDQLKAGATTIRAVSDLHGSPTYGPDLARFICDLIGSDRYGLYHATSGESASRYDVACEIVRLLCVEHGYMEVPVLPVPSREFELAGFTARRPKNEALRNYVLELEGVEMRGWREALSDYLREWA